MVKTEETVIDGYRFAVSQLPFRRSRRTLARIRAVVGPALSQLQSLNTEGFADMDVAALAPAFGDLLSRFTAEDEEAIAGELLQGARMEGEELTDKNIDLKLGGKIGTYYKLFWFALKVNYSDFFDVLGGLNLGKPVESPSEGSNTYSTTTTFGASSKPDSER